MKVFFLFMDGVGLGSDDPLTNPFAAAEMPVMEKLLGGRKMLTNHAPVESERATLLRLDACLGVKGLPQSASGQAALLTGQNVPAILGYHYGPKPNPPIAEIVSNGNLFDRVQRNGKRVAFLNAYPPRYFEGIQSGRRLYSAIPLAAISADVALRNAVDLAEGQAVSADFTAQGWRDHLGLPDTPVLSPRQAGKRLAKLALSYDFSLFEFWLSDYAGHKQDMTAAIQLLETFDQVLEGLLGMWEDEAGVILITSDHGNLEDLSTRRHTANPVPGLVIGAPELRLEFAECVRDLTDIYPAILKFVGENG